MGIDFSGFSSDIQSKIQQALADDGKISKQELQKMGLKKDVQQELMRQLAGNPDALGDGFTRIKVGDMKLTFYDKPNDGEIDLTEDTIAGYKKEYPDADIAGASLYKGTVFLRDSKGRLAKDKEGNPIVIGKTEEPEVKSSFAEWYKNNNQNFDIETLQAMEELDNRISQMKDVDGDVYQLMSEINLAQLKEASEDDKKSFFERLDAKAEYKKAQAKEMLNQAKQMLLEADEQGNIPDEARALFNCLMAACQVADNDIGLTKFKEFFKDISGLNAGADALTNLADNGNGNNLSFAENMVELLKGAGRGADSFIGTQAAAFIAALAGGAEAATVAGLGEAFSLITTGYFIYEGGSLLKDGVTEAINAETKEQAGEAGEKLGMAAIMLTGTAKGGVKAYKNSQQARLTAKYSEMQPDALITELGKDIKPEEKNAIKSVLREKGYSVQERPTSEGQTETLIYDEEGKLVETNNLNNSNINVKVTENPDGTKNYDIDNVDSMEDIMSQRYENSGRGFGSRIFGKQQKINNIRLEKGQYVEIQGSAKLNLANRVEIDLNDAKIKSQIDNLPEGGRLTIGREGDIRINDPTSYVSRIHVIIEKRNGRIYVIDNSTNGTTVTQTKASEPIIPRNANADQRQANNINSAKAEAYAKFDKRLPSSELPANGRMLDRTAQYLIDSDNLPTLVLIDGTKVDLSNAEILNMIKNLREGESFTIGRKGDVKLDSASDKVSRHHILITRHNNQIIMKDISSNGRTTCNTKAKAKPNANNAAHQDYYGNLSKGQRYEINEYPVINLANITTIDLSTPNIKARIDNLPEGGRLTIGREGDIQINDPSSRISRVHVIIEKRNGKIYVTDNSTNGTSIVKRMDDVEVEVIAVEHAAQPHSTPKNAIQQSQNFNTTHKVGTDETVMDGYKDGGRRLKFDENGNPLNNPNREIILVDRTRDTKLQSIVSDVKRQTHNMTDKQKAAFLQKYVYNLCGDGGVASDNCTTWSKTNKGREVLIGDIVTQKPPVAVCRHRSLLLKILGDEIGLKVELQRGNFYDAWGGGGHAWNVIKFDDGTSAIYDAMHNKTSNITPGNVDEYAKNYTDVYDKKIYKHGI